MEAHVSVEDEKLNGEEAQLNEAETGEENSENSSDQESAVEESSSVDTENTADQKNWQAEAEALAQQIEAFKEVIVKLVFIWH